MQSRLAKKDVATFRNTALNREMPAPLPITLKVREILKARGLSLADMAGALSRSRETVQNVINGSMVRPVTAQAIADFLGIEIAGTKPAGRPAITLKLLRGTEIKTPTALGARLLASHIGAAARCEGNRVAIIRSVSIRIT